VHTRHKRPLRTERVIFTPYITRNGRRIYAREYGLKAFRFTVPK
jgi:hypothetical protein